MVARNVYHLSAICSFGKPANTVAQRVMNVSGRDEHIEVWRRVRQIPAALLDKKVRKSPDAYQNILGARTR